MSGEPEYIYGFRGLLFIVYSQYVAKIEILFFFFFFQINFSHIICFVAHTLFKLSYERFILIKEEKNLQKMQKIHAN